MANKGKLEDYLNMNSCQLDKKLSKTGTKIRFTRGYGPGGDSGVWTNKKCEDMEPDTDLFYGKEKYGSAK